MIDKVAIGARVSMTPKEAQSLCGDGKTKLVRCPNGMIVAGVGAVGFFEFIGDIALDDIEAKVKEERERLSVMALQPEPANPRTSLYTFIRI